MVTTWHGEARDNTVRNGAKFIHVKYSYLLTNILTSHVSRSLRVSVGVSALGTTSIHFIEPGVKVNDD